MAIHAAASLANEPPRGEWWPPRWLVLVLFCLVLVVRGRIMLAMIGSLDRDPDGYCALAYHLYEHGTFATRQLQDGSAVPTAFRPPLYPLLLALPLHWMNHNHAIIGCLHVTLSMFTVWAAWRLAIAWKLPAYAALLAAGWVAFDPILINQSAQAMSETFATCLATLTLLALARAVARGTLFAGALAGALFGLCALCRPTFIVSMVGAVFVLPYCLWRLRQKPLLPTAAFALAAALVLSPWALRNHREFGRPIITTTHGGYTLLLANNPYFYRYLNHGDWGTVWDATELNWRWEPQASDNQRPQDELAQDANAYQSAYENISEQPYLFAYACLVRVGRFWGVLPHQLSPDESPARRGLRYLVAVWYACELSLALVGLWVLRRQMLDSPVIWALLLMLSLTAVHAVYWSDMRMRAPLTAVVGLLAARGVVSLACQIGFARRFAHTT